MKKFGSFNSKSRPASPLVVMVGFVACAVVGCSAMSWKSPLGQNHPLTGRIWDVAAAGFIDQQSLVESLVRAEFVLLGERHDNPDHHLLQAGVVRSLITTGRRPAVGFEMLGVDDASTITAHIAVAPNDAAGLGRAVNWNQRGWPDWAMYQPIAEAALEAKLRIVATNLPLATARNLTRDGLAALEARVAQDLGMDRPLPDPLFARIAADIRDAHCGYASEQTVKAMVDVQRARDAQMAQSLFAAGDPDGAILVAGTGHVRKDYGIPGYLRTRAPEKRVISIAFVEVDKLRTEPQSYALPYPNGRFPFDYVWFTPSVDDEDPCEKFKARFDQMKKAR